MVKLRLSILKRNDSKVQGQGQGQGQGMTLYRMMSHHSV